MSVEDYRIIDEIEPVRERAWALSPQTPLLAAMLVGSPALAAMLGCANSFLLGHPRRRQHLPVAMATVGGCWAVVGLCLFVLPESSWKYVLLARTALKFYLGYYLADEQEWPAAVFEEAGGKVLGLRESLLFVYLVGRYFGRWPF